VKTDDTQLQIKRVIKANRPAVYEAWTKPDLLKQWFHCGPTAIPTAVMDVRAGGSYRLTTNGGCDGQPGKVILGVYEDVVPNERLVMSWAHESGPMRDEIGDTRLTVEFKDVPGGTELTLTHTRFATAKQRDAHNAGWSAIVPSLAEFLEKPKATNPNIRLTPASH
jgi:uncharacterized protein YndB with AHSA1/START domain